jgi:hypothetical protein
MFVVCVCVCVCVCVNIFIYMYGTYRKSLIPISWNISNKIDSRGAVALTEQVTVSWYISVSEHAVSLRVGWYLRGEPLLLCLRDRTKAGQDNAKGQG